MLRQDPSAQQKGADPSLEQKDALPGEYAQCTFVRFCEIFEIFWNEYTQYISIHHNTINTPLRQIAAELRQNCGRMDTPHRDTERLIEHGARRHLMRRSLRLDQMALTLLIFVEKC